MGDVNFIVRCGYLLEDISSVVVVVSFFFFFKQKTAYEMLRSLVGSEMCIRDRVKSRINKFNL